MRLRWSVCWSLLLIATTARADPRAGLVAWYRCESLIGGVLRDESPNHLDLRANGSLALAPGRFGQALQMSGQGFPQRAADPRLELAGEFTLEAWIKPAAHPASGMRIFDRQTIGGNDGFMLDTWPSGHLRFISAACFLRSDADIPLNEWTHIAICASASEGEARLVQNGQVVAQSTGSGRLKASAHPLRLGANQAGGDQFRGLLDEVRIWSRALSAEELAAHLVGREIEPPTAPGAEPLPVLCRDDRPQVDYAALCARNDLVYRQPARYPFEAMHLGNGNLGVTLWNEGGLTWQANNGRYRLGGEPLSSGRVTLDTPALRQVSPPRFEQRQSLWNGTVTTRVDGPDGAAEATSLVAEGDDLLLCRVRESGRGPRELRLHLWPSRGAARFVRGPDWVAVVEPSGTKHPLLPGAMALLVRVEGAAAKADQLDQRTLRLSLAADAGAFTMQVANGLGETPEAALSAAQAMVERARAKGWDRLLAERQAFWHAFWPRSFFHLTSPNGEGDFLENLWYLYAYDLASMSRRTLCPKFNGGNWLVAEDQRHWGGGYWHQNTRELFWPTYAAGHAELADPFFELYGRAAAGARESGQKGLGVDGYYIPEWVSVTADPVRHKKDFSRPGYTAFIFTVGLEVALQGWWRYEFTGDEQHLRAWTYPLLKGCLDLYLNYAKRGPDGRYHLDPADAQETYWLVRDPHQDLAALRWAIPVALAVSQRLGLDAALRPRWQDLLDHLAPYPVDATKDIFRAADLKPTDTGHNSENVELYGIYPFGVLGLGRPDYDRAVRTFRQRYIQGMGNGWEPAAVVAARLGLAEEARRLCVEHLGHNLRAANGCWYSPTVEVFAERVPDSPYFDAPGVMAQTLQEMALQSDGGVIRLAPAWPERWQAQFSLWARGGFKVTAETHQGRLRYALIESTRGGECRLASPWGEPAVVTSGGREVARGTGELRFATTAGAVYRLERVAEPLTRMAFAPLAPAPADGPKHIGRTMPAWPGWPATWLGIGADGRTPQRGVMQRHVDAARARLAEVTQRLVDLSSGRAEAQVVGPKGAPTAAPSLVDGHGGRFTEVPHDGAVVIKLEREMVVQAVAFARDWSGLRVDRPVVGYTLSWSLDGQTWQPLLDRAKQRAAPAGQVDRTPDQPARFVRLQVRGQYDRGPLLETVTVYGHDLTK